MNKLFSILIFSLLIISCSDNQVLEPIGSAGGQQTCTECSTLVIDFEQNDGSWFHCMQIVTIEYPTENGMKLDTLGWDMGTVGSGGYQETPDGYGITINDLCVDETAVPIELCFYWSVNEFHCPIGSDDINLTFGNTSWTVQDVDFCCGDLCCNDDYYETCYTIGYVVKDQLSGQCIWNSASGW